MILPAYIIHHYSNNHSPLTLTITRNPFPINQLKTLPPNVSKFIHQSIEQDLQIQDAFQPITYTP